MTRVLARTSFHSSNLIRCLADLALLDTAGPDNAFAEKLGTWIHFTDAITLSAVQQEAAAPAAQWRPGLGLPALRKAASAEFARVRTMLANSITRSCSPDPGRSYLKLPEPVLDLPLDLATAYQPYRRFHEAQQRDMELNIQPLRVNLRAAAARMSPQLKKLSELDATFDKILRERESRSLGRVPLLLKARFEQLFKEHQDQLAASGQTDIPAGWIRPGGWLSRFCNELQALLLAELELRLQPALGLLEAIQQEPQ